MERPRCPSVPSPRQIQMSAVHHGMWFLEGLDVPSESLFPLSAGLQGHHCQSVATDTGWSPELSICVVILQPLMWGFLADSISCP